MFVNHVRKAGDNRVPTHQEKEEPEQPQKAERLRDKEQPRRRQGYYIAASLLGDLVRQ